MERKEVRNAYKNCQIFPLLKQTKQKNFQLNIPAAYTVKQVFMTSEVQKWHISII